MISCFDRAPSLIRFSILLKLVKIYNKHTHKLTITHRRTNIRVSVNNEFSVSHTMQTYI